jgi:FkbM family methyltransferase
LKINLIEEIMPAPDFSSLYNHRARRLINALLRPLDLEISRRHPLDPFWVQSFLTKGEHPIIFDVGAHIGNITALYQKLFPSCTIHAFEPLPETWQILEHRFNHNLSVKLNEVAVTDAVGSILLNANVSSKTNSILATDPRVSDFWPGPFQDTTSTIRVPTTTIDAYCKANAIDSIDILKLDVQGAELHALRGASSMLENRRVKLIYMEVILVPTYVGQFHFEDYLRFFRSVGYVMLDIFSPVRKNFRLLQSDIIFVQGSE